MTHPMAAMNTEETENEKLWSEMKTTIVLWAADLLVSIESLQREKSQGECKSLATEYSRALSHLATLEGLLGQMRDLIYVELKGIEQ